MSLSNSWDIVDYQKNLNLALKNLQNSDGKSSEEIARDLKIYTLYNEPSFQEKAKSFFDRVLSDKIITHAPQEDHNALHSLYNYLYPDTGKAKFDITDYMNNFCEIMLDKRDSSDGFELDNVAIHYQASLLQAHNILNNRDLDKITEIGNYTNDDCYDFMDAAYLAFFQDSISKIENLLHEE